ncbi:MAG TPA: hypothetical protein VHB51_00715 [Candidatus Saccharimonadales bacterium]|nr:hypothetical protein [Candidatus Saccharimonadales bacterium]
MRLVTYLVHQHHNGAEAILRDQTADARRKQADPERHYTGSPVPERLMIIRRHGVVLSKVGTYTRAEAA